MNLLDFETLTILYNIDILINHLIDASFLLAMVMLAIYIVVSSIVYKYLNSVSEPKTKITKSIKAISKLVSIILGVTVSLLFFRIATSIIQTSVFIFNI